MLDTALGIALYLLLRNDHSWARLSPDEKQIILCANQAHNTERPDYADPALYKDGKSFDSQDDRSATALGRVIQDFLEIRNPRSVVEFGPGSGYYTRQIVEYPSIRQYCAIDINDAFLNFVESRVKEIAKSKDLAYRFLCADFMDISDVRGDAVILLSAVHHIPNRVELFQAIDRMLPPGGRVLAVDPSHYWPRIRVLLRKMRTGPHLTKAFRADRSHLSTHHFCTLGEYRKICREIASLRIEDWHVLQQAGWIPRLKWGVRRRLSLTAQPPVNAGFLDRLFSTEIAVVMGKIE